MKKKQLANYLSKKINQLVSYLFVYSLLNK
jgi:hypothetical protein